MIFLASSSYANSSSSFCDAQLHPSLVHNLTSSYADQSNEATMVFTSVVMFMLAALFFSLNLFSRLSVLSAILNPSVRLFLSTSLTLFLPVMSYLFSEAKNESSPALAAAAASPNSSSYSQPEPGTVELSVRARTILIWMLLVELLRKKVEAILVNVAGMQQWYSSTIDRASRIAWLGYLVFNNLRSTGRKALYGALWVLAAAKLLERVAINELVKRSFAYGKNAELLGSYMAAKMQAAGNVQEAEEGAELLKKCEYVVMGEENVEVKPGPEGYHIVVDTDANSNNNTIVTVGKIWAEEDGVLQQYPSLKRLCLSLALYKLLRRRFEDLPITQEETRNCQGLVFRGLRKELLQVAEVALSSTSQGLDEERKEDLKGTVVAVAVFQVLEDEIQFLCEYYHSVLPVVLSSPFFFLANYILFPMVVWASCLLTFVLCGNGDVRYAYRSFNADSYIVAVGKPGSFLKSLLQCPEVLFTTLDLAITLLLLLTFLYEQVWEFLVLILSNWLMVSLVCEYTAAAIKRRRRVLISRLIRCILWARSKISRDNLCFNQFSVLGLGGLLSSMMLMPNKKAAAVPVEVKKSIMKYLVAQTDAHDAPLSSNGGWSAVHRLQPLPLLRESKSVAEVILVLHIATSLLDGKYYYQTQTTTTTGGGAARKVATTLSGYCAYLVASYPELLPANKDGTKHVYKEMQEQLKKKLGGCWRYHLSSLLGTRYDKLDEIAKGPEDTTMVQRGAQLGEKLARHQEEALVWDLLADLWTELIVYVAPSSGELHVKAHKEALAQGGEFITLLWALCTHTGITRPALAPWEAQDP